MVIDSDSDEDETVAQKVSLYAAQQRLRAKLWLVLTV